VIDERSKVNSFSRFILNPSLEILPIDSSSQMKYLIIVNGDRRFEVSTALYQILDLIDGERTTQDIAQEYQHISNKECTALDIEKIVKDFFIPREIVIGNEPIKPQKKQRSYVYFKIRLFTQEMLNPLTRILHVLFNKNVFISITILIALFHLFFYTVFPRPSISLNSIDGFLLLGAYFLLLCTTVFHELGHSSACHHFGAKHGDIGIGLYLYYFVFYADVTDVWRLNRFERAVVDFGGIYFQLICIPFIYLFYLATNNLIFIYLIYMLDLSLIGSLNPLFRFDGYWIASDLTGIPNLRMRSREYLAYLFKRVIGKAENIPPQLNIKGKVKYLLLAYSLLSNLFFIVIFYHIMLYLPVLIINYPKHFFQFLSGISQAISTLNFNAILPEIKIILFPTLILIMSGMMFFRFSIKIISFFKKFLVSKV